MSPFTYGCFISYRNGERVDDRPQKSLLNTFAIELHDALKSELEAYLDVTPLIFLDSEILDPGDIIHKKISEALCKSVCTILIFTPNYFSEVRPFCTSEYIGAVKRETIFKEQLNMDTAQKGSIFTIILRGPNKLPDELKNRLYYDFSKFDLAEGSLQLNANFNRRVRDIAEAIADFCEIVEEKCKSHQHNVFEPCANFLIPNIDIPSEREQVIAYIQKIKKEGKSDIPPFPFET